MTLINYGHVFVTSWQDVFTFAMSFKWKSHTWLYCFILVYILVKYKRCYVLFEL